MERTAWTDERLDDLAGEVRELRTEMRSGFDEVNRRIDAQGAALRGAMDAQGVALRGGMDAQGVELRGAIDSLRQTILRVGGGMMVGLIGVIAAVLVRGV